MNANTSSRLSAVFAVLVGVCGSVDSRVLFQTPASKPTSPPTASQQSTAARPVDSQPATSQPASSQPASSPLTPLSNFHAIVEGRAYRCAQPGTDVIEHVVREKKIRTIVNLRGENEKQGWYQIEKAACEKLGVKMIDIRLSASAYPSRENLLKMYDLFSDPANEPILLHCKSGADRSGMAAALWRMTALKQDAKTALGELTLKYGHFRRVHPEMSKTVELYQPRREWIEKKYAPPEGGKDSDD